MPLQTCKHTMLEKRKIALMPLQTCKHTMLEKRKKTYKKNTLILIQEIKGETSLKLKKHSRLLGEGRLEELGERVYMFASVNLYNVGIAAPNGSSAIRVGTLGGSSQTNTGYPARRKIHPPQLCPSMEFARPGS